MSKRDGMNMIYGRMIVQTCLTREVGDHFGSKGNLHILGRILSWKRSFCQNDKSKY